MMLTSIIIVSYNSRLELERCLESILQNTHSPLELIVVDNHSTGDDSVAFLKAFKSHPLVLVLNQSNLGYATACNQGLRIAKGELLVTMNPDLRVPPNWLNRMHHHLKINYKTLVIGPKGIGISGAQAAGRISFARNLAAADRKFARINKGQSQVTKYLIGCLLLFDRKLIKTIGYYDEQLPLGADDFDLSIRVRQAGYELRVACDVLIEHTVHASFNRSPVKDCDYLARLSWDHFNDKWAKELRKFGWDNLFENQRPVYNGEAVFQV